MPKCPYCENQRTKYPKADKYYKTCKNESCKRQLALERGRRYNAQFRKPPSKCIYCGDPLPPRHTSNCGKPDCDRAAKRIYNRVASSRKAKKKQRDNSDRPQDTDYNIKHIGTMPTNVALKAIEQRLKEIYG